jgi:dipeptidyl aminopeptidase/acylaminoacyl peptidase
MTDHELEQRLRTWYRAEIPAKETAPAALRSRLAAIPQAIPTPLGRRAPSRGLTLLAAAAVLTAAIVGGALLAGSDLFAPPSVVAPSGLPSADASTVTPTVGPVAGVIVYTRWKTLRDGEEDCTTTFVFCHRATVYISNADGSDEQVLVAGPYAYVLAASPVGPTVLIRRRDADGDHTYLTDVTGAPLQRLETHCQAPCGEDWYGFTFSPDGKRLAWIRSLTDERPVIAIMDMSTGAVVELASTLGIAAPPSWSPDASRLVFGNLVVDADGSNLQQFAPADLFRGMEGEFAVGLAAPQWSPDGSLIAFASFHDRVITGNSQQLNDIYVVGPDGTGLQRLTTDTIEPLPAAEIGAFGASFPTWTRDGHITFSRYPTPQDAAFELWVMDRDGGNMRQLDPSDAAALTALGCVSCAYPSTGAIDLGLPSPIAFWVPAR